MFLNWNNISISGHYTLTDMVKREKLQRRVIQCLETKAYDEWLKELDVINLQKRYPKERDESGLQHLIESTWIVNYHFVKIKSKSKALN